MLCLCIIILQVFKRICSANKSVFTPFMVILYTSQQEIFIIMIVMNELFYQSFKTIKKNSKKVIKAEKDPCFFPFFSDLRIKINVCKDNFFTLCGSMTLTITAGLHAIFVFPQSIFDTVAPYFG